MQSETKVCQNCKKDFIIEPDDFAFYEKMKVPPPTWCSECRFQRRIVWRNEWRLFKNKDARTGLDVFTNFSPEAPVKIYDRDFWLSDGWDPLEYSRDIDWSRPFLEQIKELLYIVPIFSRAAVSIVNSDYSMNAGWLKNAFMTFNSDYVEDSGYIFSCVNVKNSFDCELAKNLELCYSCFNVNTCYKTFFSTGCEDCHDIILCRDCFSCSNCFGCVNLKSKNYYIFNEPYSKEEYFKKLKFFNVNTYSGLIKEEEAAYNFWKKFPVKFAHVRQNLNSTGEYVFNSKNVKDSYRVYENAEDCRYCQSITMGPEKGCYDHTAWGKGAEQIYEALQVGDGAYNIKFSIGCYTQTRDIEYSLFCPGGKNLFGCVSAHHKQYCILNKQYSKEEYEELVSKIKKHMEDMPYVDSKGRVYEYGEFFPPEFAPYSYGETLAQEYFPLNKEEALIKNFTWRDDKKRNYSIVTYSKNLPDSIVDVDESVANKVIECEHRGECSHACNGAFIITSDELHFLREMKIPLPRLCPHCRHYERIKFRNSFRLYHRKCMKLGCVNEFETSYAPERPEIVYCESCYNNEVA